MVPIETLPSSRNSQTIEFASLLDRHFPAKCLRASLQLVIPRITDIRPITTIQEGLLIAATSGAGDCEWANRASQNTFAYSRLNACMLDAAFSRLTYPGVWLVFQFPGILVCGSWLPRSVRFFSPQPPSRGKRTLSLRPRRTIRSCGSGLSSSRRQSTPRKHNASPRSHTTPDVRSARNGAWSGRQVLTTFL